MLYATVLWFKQFVRDFVANAMRNDETSNELIHASEAPMPGSFHAAHNFSINNSTMNDVNGDYIHTEHYHYEASKTEKSLRRALKPEDMNETNRTPCLKNTRRNVIDDILNWISGDSSKKKQVLWVYGLAGTGKSTLSTTIAKMLRSRHHLGAFYFFSRDTSQRTAETLIRTLAYQLAIFDAHFGATISKVVAEHDNIAIMPLEFQFDNLLSANALKFAEWSGEPIVLIIDALDECGSEVDREILLQALSKGFSNLPSFIRIIIVSRPESDIQHVLGSHLHLHPYTLDIDSVTNKNDVSEFIRHCLEKIRIKDKDGYLEDDWPGDDKIKSLADAADGLFIWASTACLYIDGFDPQERLSNVINKQTSSGPFTRLDILYKTGLSAGPWDDSSFSSGCRRMLGAILCARIPLSRSVIDTLLEFRLSGKIASHLRCVLDKTENGEFRILHASFYDYLVSERCRDEPWSINLQHHNKELALRCIKLLDKELRENMCDMTLPYLSQKRTLPDAISYACQFWIEHICLVSDVTDDIVNQLNVFLGKHLLHWMEAMAILKSHDRTIKSIDNLMKWLKSSRSDTELYQLLYDGHRFSLSFANTINVHPLLLYTAALPFAPINTSIFKKFYHSGLPKVVCGMDETWSPVLIQLLGHKDRISSVAFSPDGSKIISGSFDKTIQVWDANTGIKMLPPLRGHDDKIRCVAFSPDGSKIISGSYDKTIRVWNASAGIEMLFSPLRGHDDTINSVAFSPDGSKIISGSHDKTIRVWDASTGTEMLPPLRGHDGAIESVAFSPDGSKIISGSFDNTIRVWDTRTGNEMLPPLRGHDNWITSVAFSPDGSKIISGSFDFTIRVWNASTGIEMRPCLDHHRWITSVAFSPDGSKIISGSEGTTIEVWDASTGVSLSPLRGHDDRIDSVAFSPDGLKIISGSKDKTIRVWDASSIKLRPILFARHKDNIRSIAFSPDGSKIISGSNDETIRVWDARTGNEMLPPLRGHRDWIASVAFSPDGSKIISGSQDETIRVWDASTGAEMLPALRGHNHEITSVAFSPDGSKIISGSYDLTIRVWDVNTGTEMLPPLKGHEDRIYSIAFSPDGSKIISSSFDETIRVWDANTGTEILSPLRGHGGPIYSVAFSPDGSKIISGSYDETIRVWNASTGVEILPPLPHNKSIHSVAFSPDGSKIISASGGTTIEVWNASTGIKLRPLQGYGCHIYNVAFSPDGSTIISDYGDKTIRVWDASGIEMLPPPPFGGHDDQITSVAFSPDGSKIISGSFDKTIRVWDARSGIEMLPRLRGHDSLICSVAFSPDGSKIISGSRDRSIRVWDASTGIEMKFAVSNYARISHVAFSPNGSKILAVEMEKNVIQVRDASTGDFEMLQYLEGHEKYISSVAFSPDGSKIISGSEDKTIRVWDANTGIEMLPPLRGHDGAINSLAFSPDGSKIISGSSDRTIRVWDASTGFEISPPLRVHEGGISSVTFSPDGSKIISASFDKIIGVWDAGTGIPLSHQQKLADDSPSPAMDERMIGWWLVNINTGGYMGALPVDAGFYSASLCGPTTYVAWTADHRLLLVHFPEP